MPECVVLDPKAKSWIPGLRALTAPRSHSSAVALSQGAYIIGGTSSRFSSEFLPTDYATTNSQKFWEKGPDLPISMEYGCAVSISSTAFMIVSKSEVRVFEGAFEPENPTSNSNWMDSTLWPKLQTERWYHPGCAVIQKTVVIAGGFTSLISSAFSYNQIEHF